MSEEMDRYHELERNERMSWRPLVVAFVLSFALGAPVILACYYLYDRFRL